MLTTNQLPGSVRALKAPPPGIRQARPPPAGQGPPGQGPPASRLPPPLGRGWDTDRRLSVFNSLYMGLTRISHGTLASRSSCGSLSTFIVYFDSSVLC